MLNTIQIGRRVWLVILTASLKVKDFSRSQAVHVGLQYRTGRSLKGAR